MNGGDFMLNCLDAARYFISHAYEDGREAEMTNMKVQKLLYYAQSLHLALFKSPLFDEEIQAWRYGPVCPPAYRFYSRFEAEQLPIPQMAELPAFSDTTQQLLAEVWDYFGIHHAYTLSSMTHLEFPWKKARKGLLEQASSTEPILLEDMQLLGEQKLLEIERENPVYKVLLSQALEDAFDATEPQRVIPREEIDEWLESLLA
jgi:uncharacterized phage-associated protein